MSVYHLVAGQTGDQDFQLLEDEEPLTVPIQGLEVSLILRDKSGALVDTVSDVSVLDDGSTGKRGWVRVNLDEDDVRYNRSPYTAVWKVIDGAGKVNFFPTGDADIWIVGRGEA